VTDCIFNYDHEMMLSINIEIEWNGNIEIEWNGN
jgi:hypothetical protein